MDDIDKRIDALKLGPYHYWIFLICTLIVLFDGYDGSAMAFVAPAMKEELHFTTAILGPIFSAHLVGMVIGSAAIGLLADRFGRRPAIILSTALFGLFSGLAATQAHLGLFFVYRFLTGVGLGGAVGNAVAVCAEFAPARVRATVVSIVYSAFPLGAVFGGYLSVGLIAHFGWRSVFVAGALVTIPMLILCLVDFPESVRFLRQRGTAPGQIEAILRKLGSVSIGPTSTTDLPARPDFPLSALFRDGMAGRTLALWLAFFVNQLVVYFLFMWMPTVMKTWGLSVNTGIVASATQSLGGVVGALCLARVSDRKGAFGVLMVAYALAFVLCGAVGSVAARGAFAVVGVVGLAGFFLNGANVNLAAVATALYPTKARSTGVGWAMGIGKAGGIAGSLIGGVLLQSHLSLPVLYPLAATPLLIAMGAMWFLRAHARGVLVRAAALPDTVHLVETRI